MEHQKIRKSVFTTKQVKKLISKAYERHPLLGCLWHIGYLTGWRMKDLLKIKWRQIDLQNRILYGQKQLPYYTEHINIPDGLLTLLQQLGRDREPNEEYLFSDWRNRPSTIGGWNISLIDSVGLNGYVTCNGYCYRQYTFHSLRLTSLLNKKLVSLPTEKMEAMLFNAA